jgi:hypothetical protein
MMAVHLQQKIDHRCDPNEAGAGRKFRKHLRSSFVLPPYRGKSENERKKEMMMTMLLMMMRSLVYLPLRFQFRHACLASQVRIQQTPRLALEKRYSNMREWDHIKRGESGRIGALRLDWTGVAIKWLQSGDRLTNQETLRPANPRSVEEQAPQHRNRKARQSKQKAAIQTEPFSHPSNQASKQPSKQATSKNQVRLWFWNHRPGSELVPTLLLSCSVALLLSCSLCHFFRNICCFRIVQQRKK